MQLCGGDTRVRGRERGAVEEPGDVRRWDTFIVTGECEGVTPGDALGGWRHVDNRGIYVYVCVFKYDCSV